MKADANLDITLGRVIQINGGFIRSRDCFHGEFGNALGVVFRLVLDKVGHCHVGVSNCLHLLYPMCERVEMSHCYLLPAKKQLQRLRCEQCSYLVCIVFVGQLIKLVIEPIQHVGDFMRIQGG